jgi:pentachlorophenol monooxygenase/3-(3-hydroxy-phenyl)propionate hydroxylase
VAEEAAAGVPVPVALLELAVLDVTGALAPALNAQPGEIWVLRPDAHVAAVLERPAAGEVVAALRRSLGG